MIATIDQPTAITRIDMASPLMMGAAIFGQLPGDVASRYAKIGDLPTGDYGRAVNLVYRRSGSYSPLLATLRVLRQLCREAYPPE